MQMPEGALKVLRLIKKFLDFKKLKRDKKLWWMDFTYSIERTPPFSWFGKAKWWLKYRFHPSHRYHIINSRLKPGYYDRDYVLLCTSFAILCDFIEKELPWSAYDSKKVPWYMPRKWYVKKHAQELAFEHLDWKMKARMKLDENCNDDPNSDLQILHEGTWGWASKEMEELYIWWKYQRDQEHTFTSWAEYDPEALDEKDDKQLLRLMKIRGFLWT
jgi:hypothetical protein